MRLKSFCADPAAIAGYAPLLTEDGRSFGVSGLRPDAGAFAARLTGVATREAAEALKGTRLYVPRERLPALGDDEFYHADLIELAVVDAGGASLGTVRAVLDHGAGDLLEIAQPGSPELLLPFTRAVVPTVVSGGAADRGRPTFGPISDRQAWTARVLTLFPEMFPGPLGHSLIGRALEEGLWRLEVRNIRDVATDRHRTVDNLYAGGRRGRDGDAGGRRGGGAGCGGA